MTDDDERIRRRHPSGPHDRIPKSIVDAGRRERIAELQAEASDLELAVRRAVDAAIRDKLNDVVRQQVIERERNAFAERATRTEMELSRTRRRMWIAVGTLACALAADVTERIVSNVVATRVERAADRAVEAKETINDREADLQRQIDELIRALDRRPAERR